MEQQIFINKIKDMAIKMQSQYNILASIILSQAILESGWGTSELFLKANSSFGIKWTNGCGYDKYLITTKEVINGKEISVQDYFRKYFSLDDSIKDHAIFLQKERYKNIIGDKDYKSVANKLYKDGYSTSPLYPTNLIKIIETYKLNSYDSLNTYIYGWNQNATGWWYCTDVTNGDYYKNEWKLIDSEWYSFNINGYAKSNQWELYKNKWYYLDTNCKMAKSKWITWKNKDYYVGKDGAMLENTITPDGHFVDNNGVKIK